MKLYLPDIFQGDGKQSFFQSLFFKFICALITCIMIGSTSVAAAPNCPIGTTSANGTGDYRGLFDQGTGFGNSSQIESILETQLGLSNPTRIEKLDGIQNAPTCEQGVHVTAQSGTSKNGTWKSDVAICAVAIHAGNAGQPGNGKLVAVYTYTPPVTEGTWNTVNNDDKDISNIQFFTCDTTNPVEKAKLKITKETVQDTNNPVNANEFSTTDFKFTLTRIGGADVPVTITVDDYNTVTAPDLFLEPGEYVVSEDLPPANANIPNDTEWQEVSLSCTSSSNAVSIDNNNAGGPKITVASNVAANDLVQCKATNKLVRLTTPVGKGTIIIKKSADDNGAAGAYNAVFDFTWIEKNGENILNPSKLFTSDASNVEVFNQSDLRAGQYVIEEDTLANWNLESISCSENGAVNTTPTSTSQSVAARRAVINLDADETVVCVFSNKYDKTATLPGYLKIRKLTTGGVGNEVFNFTVDGKTYPVSTINHQGESSVIPLDAGAYTISEAQVAGFVTTKIECSDGTVDGNPQDRQINVNVPSNDTLTCTFTNKANDDPTDDVTKKFIKRRLDNILSSDPDRARIIRRLDQQPEEPEEARPLKLTGKLNMGDSGNLQGSNLKFSTSLNQLKAAEAARQSLKVKEAKKEGALGFMTRGLEELPNLRPDSVDVWIEGQFKRYSDSDGGFDSDGTFGIVYLGVDYAATKHFLIGALVQLDWTEEEIKGDDFYGTAEGGGWMAGPYVGVKFSDNMYLNARAAWGQSKNTIILTDDVLGRRTSKFDTDRWLVSGELGGKWEYYGLRIKPSIKVAYGNEKNDEFFNSLGQKLAANDIALGRISFGPEFNYRYVKPDGTVIKPHVAIRGLWNFGNGDLTLLDGTELDNDTFRGKVEGGVIIRMDEGTSVRLSAEYDGIGNSDFESIGGGIWVNIPLK